MARCLAVYPWNLMTKGCSGRTPQLCSAGKRTSDGVDLENLLRSTGKRKVADVPEATGALTTPLPLKVSTVGAEPSVATVTVPWNACA